MSINWNLCVEMSLKKMQLQSVEEWLELVLMNLERNLLCDSRYYAGSSTDGKLPDDTWSNFRHLYSLQISALTLRPVTGMFCHSWFYFFLCKVRTPLSTKRPTKIHRFTILRTC